MRAQSRAESSSTSTTASVVSTAGGGRGPRSNSIQPQAHLETARREEGVEPWVGVGRDGDVERRVAHRGQRRVDVALVEARPSPSPTTRFIIGESGAAGARRQVAPAVSSASAP